MITVVLNISLKQVPGSETLNIQNNKTTVKSKSWFLLQTKLDLLVLHHQVADVTNRKVTEQLDVMTSNFIKELGVPVPEEEGTRSHM